MAKLILHGASSSSREVPLHRTPMWIGRDPSNDIVLADPLASRRHAVIERRGGQHYVRDCNSLNGFTVNGDRLSERGLRNGDLVGIGATRLVYWEGPLVSPATPSKAVCAACGTAVLLPARYCVACGSRIAASSPAIEPGPSALAAVREGSFAKAARRPALGPDQLTAQQVSLIRAVVLNRADYLQRSYFLDPQTGKRAAHPLKESDWSRFVTSWSVDPIACMRAVNRAIARLRSPARIRRYLEAAVELETFMDRRTPQAPEARVLSGIPAYITDGYTDMGRNPSRIERRGREKIKVDKERLRSWLVEARWQALAHEPSLEGVLREFYEVVRRSLRFDESRVKDLSSEWKDRSVNLSRFLDDGIGLCRHYSILYQLCLQEAAIPGRVVKGSLCVFGLEGRHAWNLAWLGGRVALIDVTLPSHDGPLIALGSSVEEVYRIVNREERRYLPTPDQQNHYKIGASVDRSFPANEADSERLSPVL
jgi:FHA domain/Transglutaminase-like superfamily